MIVASVVIVICQVIIMGMLAWFIRVFGAYTSATLKAHDSNVILYQQSLKVLEYASSLLKEERSA